MEKHKNIQLFKYADEMTLGGENIEDQEEAFNTLTSWARENKLQINKDKTELMNFKKGGKTGKGGITLNGEQIKTANTLG